MGFFLTLKYFFYYACFWKILVWVWVLGMQTDLMHFEYVSFSWKHRGLNRGLVSFLRLPRWLSGKESACSAGDEGLIPGLGRCPGEGNDNLLHYSCLENSTERGAWWATVHGVTNETQLSISISFLNCAQPWFKCIYYSGVTQKLAHGVTSFVAFQRREFWPFVHCVLVAQLWLTLCGPLDCSQLGSSVHGIFQARH